MRVCMQCGVELDTGMDVCPLCETPIIDGEKMAGKISMKHFGDQRVKPKLLKHVLWQIVCVLLLSGILATLIINLSIVGRVTWSIYPASICLIILSYASLIALWDVKPVVQMITGLIASSAVLVFVQLFSGQDWPVRLALPIISAVTVVSILLSTILSNMKVKGLNILAIVFVGAAIVCLSIDAIISVYFQDQLRLTWSVVVAACLLPVTAAVLFMYLRTRNNRELQKIFHT